MPARPASAIPEGSWRGSALDYVLVVNAKIWSSRGEACDATAVYRRDTDRFANHDGHLVPEPAGEDYIGSWERTAIRATFTWWPSCQHRMTFDEVLPFRTYGNDDGFLKLESAIAPRPPPPPRERFQGVWKDIPAAGEQGRGSSSSSQMATALMNRTSLSRGELSEAVATSQALLEAIQDVIRDD